VRWERAEDDPQQSLFPGALDGDDVLDRQPGTGQFEGLELMHVRTKKIINEVPRSSRMPFRYTVNVYRGCTHACTYCFARPTHAYLDLNIAEDFDTKIVVKVNAAERLDVELASPKWGGDSIAMGTNTDPYQRVEGKYRLTRSVIEVLGKHANPFSILTKSSLVVRDLDVLTAAAQHTDVRVDLSIGTLDEDVWRRTEPGTPHPRQRIAAVRKLNAAGIPSGVLIAPVLPGLSDRPDQVAAVVEACQEAGADWIAASYLHLRGPLREHFLQWLEAERPDLVASYSEIYQRAYVGATMSKRLSGVVARVNGRNRRKMHDLRTTETAQESPAPVPVQVALPLGPAASRPR
jgi:DNA repair photolyase